MSEPNADESRPSFAGGTIRERPDRPVRRWLWVVWIVSLVAAIAYLIVTFHGRTLNPETNSIIREYNEAVHAEPE